MGQGDVYRLEIVETCPAHVECGMAARRIG